MGVKGKEIERAQGEVIPEGLNSQNNLKMLSKHLSSMYYVLCTMD